MNNRNYNIFFHTHTVSGIVISVVLFVIFFAGSFAYFRDEIINWERNESVAFQNLPEPDYNTILNSLNKKYVLHGRNLSMTKLGKERRLAVYLEPTKDSLETKKAKEEQFFYLDPKTYKTETYEESYSLGEFMYRLHFLAQIPYPIGYYLSGFVALFFLFAIITGVLVHWKKIITNFFVFRPKEKLKMLWTDAHTALGMIGLPFQFVYAVTGAFFMIKIFIVAPSVLTFYSGDDKKLYKDLEYSEPEYPFENKLLTKDFNINNLANKTKKSWENFEVSTVKIQNFGDENMHVMVEGNLHYDKQLTGVGNVIYKISENKIVFQKNPLTQNTYLDGVKNVLFRIHYADYGGYILKLLSFILGITTCFVIISGVMIWLTARDKKNMPEKKRRFNEWVVRIYLAICLSMYPITAFIFIAVKVFNPLGESNIYYIYFIGWLILSLFFIIRKNNDFTNRYSLFLGSVLGFLIPITNGIVTGNWLWNSFMNEQFQLFFVDAFWIVLASTTLYIRLLLERKNQKTYT